MNVFFFDGNCPFCLKLATHLKSKCIKNDIQFLSFRTFTEIDLQKIHKDLNTELLMGNTQFIYNGKRYPNFFAIRKLFPHLKIYKYFTLILYLPLVPILGILLLWFLKKFTSH